jgi:hypothetical protein
MAKIGDNTTRHLAWGMFTRRGDERVQAVVTNIVQHPEVRKAMARAEELVKLQEELYEINDRLGATVCEQLQYLAKEEGCEEATDSQVREIVMEYVRDGELPSSQWVPKGCLWVMKRT